MYFTMLPVFRHFVFTINFFYLSYALKLCNVKRLHAIYGIFPLKGQRNQLYSNILFL